MNTVDQGKKKPITNQKKKYFFLQPFIWLFRCNNNNNNNNTKQRNQYRRKQPKNQNHKKLPFLFGLSSKSSSPPPSPDTTTLIHFPDIITDCGGGIDHHHHLNEHTTIYTLSCPSYETEYEVTSGWNPKKLITPYWTKEDLPMNYKSKQQQLQEQHNVGVGGNNGDFNTDQPDDISSLLSGNSLNSSSNHYRKNIHKENRSMDPKLMMRLRNSPSFLERHNGRHEQFKLKTKQLLLSCGCNNNNNSKNHKNMNSTSSSSGGRPPVNSKHRRLHSSGTTNGNLKEDDNVFLDGKRKNGNRNSPNDDNDDDYNENDERYWRDSNFSISSAKDHSFDFRMVNIQVTTQDNNISNSSCSSYCNNNNNDPNTDQITLKEGNGVVLKKYDIPTTTTNTISPPDSIEPCKSNVSLHDYIEESNHKNAKTRHSKNKDILKKGGRSYNFSTLSGCESPSSSSVNSSACMTVSFEDDYPQLVLLQSSSCFLTNEDDFFHTLSEMHDNFFNEPQGGSYSSSPPKSPPPLKCTTTTGNRRKKQTLGVPFGHPSRELQKYFDDENDNDDCGNDNGDNMIHDNNESISTFSTGSHTFDDDDDDEGSTELDTALEGCNKENNYMGWLNEKIDQVLDVVENEQEQMGMMMIKQRRKNRLVHHSSTDAAAGRLRTQSSSEWDERDDANWSDGTEDNNNNMLSSNHLLLLEALQQDPFEPILKPICRMVVATQLPPLPPPPPSSSSSSPSSFFATTFDEPHTKKTRKPKVRKEYHYEVLKPRMTTTPTTTTTTRAKTTRAAAITTSMYETGGGDKKRISTCSSFSSKEGSRRRKVKDTV